MENEQGAQESWAQKQAREERELSEWLAQLSVGAVVVIGKSHEPRFAKIQGQTPTQWIVGSSRYRKTDGRQIGGCTFGRLMRPTDELRKNAEELAVRAKYRDFLYQAGRGTKEASVEFMRDILAVQAKHDSAKAEAGGQA